jgi:hypothetical protein
MAFSPDGARNKFDPADNNLVVAIAVPELTAPSSVPALSFMPTGTYNFSMGQFRDNIFRKRRAHVSKKHIRAGL